MKTKLIFTALAMFISMTLFSQSPQEIVQKSVDMIDMGTYPQSKAFLFGINIKL